VLTEDQYQQSLITYTEISVDRGPASVITLHIMNDSGPLSTLTYLYVIKDCYEYLCPDLFIYASTGIVAHCHWLARSLWIHIAHSL